MRESQRVITPEILDSLDPSDPRAIRSRRDLRHIDAFLGNTRWVVRQLLPPHAAGTGIVEIGAGSGDLCAKLQAALPATTITGLDLIERPDPLPATIRWISGDFFETLPGIRAGACVGSLILHHFPQSVLRELGRLLATFPLLVFCEPLRSAFPLAMAGLAAPFVGEVTRHDMPASIRAGFQKGELAPALGLRPDTWHIQEIATHRGSLRLVARRR